MESSIPFTWADAWVLAAVAYAEGDDGASLDHVIAAGDAINHAIVTFPELSSGLARLRAAGCVVAEGGRFRLRSGVTSTYQRLIARRRSHAAKLHALAKWLGCNPARCGDDPNPSDPEWRLGDLYRRGLRSCHSSALALDL